MTDQPQQTESSNSVNNRSGGADLNANGEIHIGGDVVGRDKTISAGTYIEHYYAGAEAAQSKRNVYHNLPQPDYVRFIGREEELAWLRERLSPEDRAWQIAITGIGGVGKSALAQAAAHFYLKQYEALPLEERFEAIVWVSAKEQILTTEGREAASLTDSIFRTLEDVYTAIAQAMEREDITRAMPAEQYGLVQKALREKRTLLVMDNLESVTDERVKPFLRKIPSPTKVLITSREWLDVADVRSLTGLSPTESDRLLREEAAVRQLDLDDPERQRLIELTAGLPLPIKLSVARLASGESFDAVTRWLGDATGDVSEYCVHGQAELVRKRESNAGPILLACSLFDRGAGASREALGYIADLSISDRDRGLAQLQRLFLVNGMDNDRFRLLPIVQRYAAVQLATSDIADRFVERWLTWLIDYARTNGEGLEFHIEDLPKMREEYPNLSLAINWCLEREQWVNLLQLMEGTWFCAYFTGLFSECQKILEAAISAASHTNNEQCLGRIHLYLARVTIGRGYKNDAALEQLRQAEIIARQFNDEVQLGWIWEHMSNVMRSQSGVEKSIELAQAALEIGKRHSNHGLQSVAALRLAECDRKRADEIGAGEWLDYAESHARAIGWSRHLAWIEHTRTGLLFDQGDFSAAEPRYYQELELRMAWGDRRFVGYIKRRLAQIYAATGRIEEARQTAEEALDLFEKLGMPRFVAQSQEILKNLTP